MTPPYTFDRSGMYFSKIIVSISTERRLKQQESNASATANKSALFSAGRLTSVAPKTARSEPPVPLEKKGCSCGAGKRFPTRAVKVRPAVDMATREKVFCYRNEREHFFPYSKSPFCLVEFFL